MILGEGVYDLLNDVFVEFVRFAFIAVLIVVAVILGAKLRKHRDKKKNMEINDGQN